jgi:hypothetical protein
MLNYRDVASDFEVVRPGSGVWSHKKIINYGIMNVETLTTIKDIKSTLQACSMLPRPEDQYLDSPGTRSIIINLNVSIAESTHVHCITYKRPHIRFIIRHVCI